MSLKEMIRHNLTEGDAVNGTNTYFISPFGVYLTGENMRFGSVNVVKCLAGDDSVKQVRVTGFNVYWLGMLENFAKEVLNV